MDARYVCDNGDRRARLIAQGFLAADGVSPLNAIDFLEVVDGVLDDVVTATDDPRQFVLLVRFLRPLGLGQLGPQQVIIEGGSSITGIQVRFALRLADLPAAPPAGWSPVAHTYLADFATRLATSNPAEPASWLVVVVDQRGDHSAYGFKLVSGLTSHEAPAGFDPVLTELKFNFKIECPSDFDCRAEPACSTEQQATPELDYLARDYQSFRRLMLDRMSVVVPDWQERNPADLGVTLVELLAYVADRAAYFQDAVATEAYLNTSRRRTSVRRHARLLDYSMHEGCNARAWVHLAPVPGQVVAPAGAPAVPRGTRFLTTLQDPSVVITTSAEADALNQSPEVFEALHDLMLLSHCHNEVRIHTWGESRCVLPARATNAALCAVTEGDDLRFVAGDVLVFEEVRHPETGQAVDADPTRRHAVRLTSVSAPKLDALCGVRFWEVRWHADDALPFAFCLHDIEGRDAGPVTVARGNILLVDHGRRCEAEELVPSEVPPDGPYRPHLQRADVTHCTPYVAARSDRATSVSASASLLQDPRQALPAIQLAETNDAWLPVRELLASDAFARQFVTETENDGRAYLRFGDGVLGRKPTAGSNLLATYRIGSGLLGNVGAEAIRHVVSDTLGGALLLVRNPLAAQGGVAPESAQAVKLQAPAAFRVQMRAVTAEDWAEVAERHAAVQRAVATLRFTGSWNTVYLTVDPIGGRALDAALQADLLAFLEQFRLAGIDLELRAPTYVPIDLALVVCASPDHFMHEVKAAVLDRLSSGLRRDNSKGWFHPDRLSFGDDVYLSPIVAQVMDVPGVAWVDLDPVANGNHAVRFQRLGRVAAGELEAGVLPVARLEVARLDNDPNLPDNGRLRLTVRGGR